MAKSNEAQLVMRLEAQTKDFNRSLKRIEGKLNGSTGRMNKRWNKSMSSMERRASRFGSAVGKSIGTGLVVGTAALVVFTKKSLQFADDLQHFSEQVGIGAERLQEYYFIASRLGLAQDTINKAFKVGTANVGEFAISGAGEAAQALKDMGLAEDIANGKLDNTADILDILIQKLGDEENALKRTGMAAEIFGKRNGAQLSEMLGLGTDAINEMKKEARALGVVMDNEAVAKASSANDMIGKLGDTIRGNFTKAIVELAPEIEELSQMLIDLTPQLVDWAKAGVQGLKGLGDAWDRLHGRQPKIRTVEGAEERASYIRKLADTYRDYVSERERGEKALAALEEKYGVRVGKTNTVSGKTHKKITKSINDAKQDLLDSINRDFDKDIVAKYTVDGVVDVEPLLSSQYKAVLSLKEKLEQTALIVPTGGRDPRGGAGGSGSSKPTRLTDEHKKAIEAAAERQREENRIQQELLAQAKAMYDASRTPMEEYQARLVELTAAESNTLQRIEAGGSETFARLRISALAELADATGDYEGSLRQLNILQTQGIISAEDAVKAKDAIAQSTEYTQRLIDKKMELLDIEAREVEQALILAELGGGEQEIQRLERKLAIIRETMNVISNGGNPDTAEGSATDFIEAQDIANIKGQIRDATKGAFRAAVDGEFGDYLADKLSNAADSMFDRAIDSLLDSLFKNIDFGSLLKGGGGFFSKLLSFDGGGHTGAGARSGGIDGKGGFPAILHPNETIVDHTKSLVRPNSNGLLRGAQASVSRSVSVTNVNHFNGVTHAEIMGDVNRSQQVLKQQIDGEFNGRVQEYSAYRESGLVA